MLCIFAEVASSMIASSLRSNSRLTADDLRLFLFNFQSGRLGGDNTSDEEFERQLEEAEALQEEEQKRRRQQRSLNARRSARSSVESPGQIHVSASAPNLAASHGIKRNIIARVPLMGGNRQTEDGYETDHQDYCDVCQQVSHFSNSS